MLINLGIKRGMVVYGQDKLDEISLSAPTTVCEIRDGWFKSSVITPEDFGLTAAQRGAEGRDAGGERRHHTGHFERESGDQAERGAAQCRGGPVYR